MRGRRVKRVRRAGTLALLVALLAATTAYAAIGDLTQKAGTAGCVSDDGTGGACQAGVALDAAGGVAVSPDGRSVYVATGGANGDAVLIFNRNLSTGALTQKAGTAGCVSETGTGGDCEDGVALDGASDVAVSPDGTSVYVVSIQPVTGNAVAVFERNTTNTLNRGALTQKSGTDACISDTGTGGECEDGTALNGASSVAVSPDGNSVYVGSSFSQAVAIFDRNTTNTAARGTLTQKPGTDGCWSLDGTPLTGGTCQDGTGLGVGLFEGVTDVGVSPDGDSVYATANGSDSIAVFDRDTTISADHGKLTQKAATAGCVADVGSVECADGKALDFASGLAVSSDGASVYVASGTGNGAVAIFDRDTTNTAARGTLTQKADPDGCWSDAVTAGCQDGVALTGAVGVAVSPDGASVYAAAGLPNGDAVSIFDRDTSASPSEGTLTQEPAPAGCVSQTGSGGTCQDGEALDGAANVAVSPNNASVYVTSLDSDAVAIFDRATTDVAPPTPPTTPPGGGGGGEQPAPGDTSPPDTQVTAGPKNKTKKKKATFEFGGTDARAVAAFECSLDGGPFQPCTSPHKVKVKKGKHSFEVRAVDAAGNVDPTPASDSWKRKKRKKRK